MSKAEGNQALEKPDPADWPGNTDQSAYEDKNRTLRGRTLCAWLAPLLAGSVNARRDEARKELSRWVDRVGRENAGSGDGDDDFPVMLEMAPAQGFKYCGQSPSPERAAGGELYLAERAMEMLKKTRFWFSQLTLVQALCLWSLPEAAGERRDGAAPRPDGQSTMRGLIATARIRRRPCGAGARSPRTRTIRSSPKRAT